MSSEGAIVLKDVNKIFNGKVHALKDVSVEFHPQKVNVLLGLSGSGKSTLLRHINGLHLPTSGTVETLGVRVDQASTQELRHLRRDIAMVFQHFNLVGPSSVLENVCSGALGSLRGPRMGLFSYPKALKERALEHLARVGLADKAYQRADTLSGGQQQRVAIARALIQEPKILLADEPVASLDPISSNTIIELIRRIAREDNLTVVMSLHQVQIAMGYSDRIIGLNQGEVVMDANTADITREDAFHIYSSVSSAGTSHVEELDAGNTLDTPAPAPVAQEN